MNNNQLDSFSILIVLKYLKTTKDYRNIICINSKFKEITNNLRFNPIPIKSLKLFPNTETQYIYSENDCMINGVSKYEIWYKIGYYQYLEFKEDNIQCHHVDYTKENRKKYGEDFSNVTSLNEYCFSNSSTLTSINLQDTTTSLGLGCFYCCLALIYITLPCTLISIDDMCFISCSSLQSINLPPKIKHLGERCFMNCFSLTSIKLPSLLISLGNYCFYSCYKLTTIDFPSTLTTINNNCFINCYSLKTITLPSTLQSLGGGCFYCCSNLESINVVNYIKIGNKCFYGCNK